MLRLLLLLGREDAHSSGGREGAVDIEEADGVLDGTLGEGRDDTRGGGGGGHVECCVVCVLSVAVCMCMSLKRGYVRVARKVWCAGKSRFERAVVSNVK